LSRAGDLARAQVLARDAVEVCHAQEITGLVAELTYQTSVLVADASSQFGTISDIATHAEGTAQLCFDGYVSVLLAHYDNAGLSVTGILVLRASPAHFDSRQALRLGAELSRTLAAAE
jgi:hypothetical protein